MIYSIFVYVILTLIMLLFYTLSKSINNNCIERYKSVNIPFIAILIFSIVFGIRYDVGIDYLAYLKQYENYQILRNDLDTELGYAFLIKLFVGAGLHYSVFFGFLAFLQLFLLCFALRDHYKVVGWVLFIFMLSTTFLNFLNVIRQNTAFCFEIVALSYLAKKKYVYCYFNIFFAILFHISAVILLPLPLLFIYKDNYFKNIRIQIMLFLGALFVGVVIRPALFVFMYIARFATHFGYANYGLHIEAGNMKFMEVRRELGLGFLLLVVINLINILNSNKVKSYWKSRFLDIVYDLYFIGLLYNYVVLGSLILARISIYFYSFNFIISSFTLYFLSKKIRNKNNAIVLSVMLLAYLGIFGAVIILRGADSHAIYRTIFDAI